MANYFPLLFFFFFFVTFQLGGHRERAFQLGGPDISLLGNASAIVSANTSYISLTPPFDLATLVDAVIPAQFGWATYNKAVPLANFTTHFRFSIRRGGSGGDGLAFFMAPFDLEPPENATDQWLGLFDQTSDGNYSNQIVAVEFDTFQNLPFDMNDNHVGIDVNSVISMKNISLSRHRLSNGMAWDAWVDYDSVAKELHLFLVSQDRPPLEAQPVQKPTEPILSYPIDLTHFLPQNIKLGFSASTEQGSNESHVVYLWEFSSQYWPELNTPTASPPLHNPRKRPQLHNPSKSPTNKKREVIVSSVMACIVVVTIASFTLLCARRWHVSNQDRKQSKELDKRFEQGPRKVSYAVLRAATKNFSNDQMLGQGGFGPVYRGILSASKEPVAVKRISQASKQGEKEYVSEVSIISKLRHRNLVQLHGWCHEKGKLLLVYEFLQKGSLDKYLFGEQRRGDLNWERRYNIACDIASALLYLHQEWDQRVVHRDVKASNVMLDDDFNAKLGDFGLARVVERDRAASNTTVVAGTFGYVAPECMTTGKASIESDMFSFGAVTLEIACGRRAVDRSLDDHNWRLVEWVWDLYGSGKVLEAADAKLGGNFNVEEMERVMLVGLLCSHPDPKARLSIGQVMDVLKMKAPLPRPPQTYPIAVYSGAPAPAPVVALSSLSSGIFCTAKNDSHIDRS